MYVSQVSIRGAGVTGGPGLLPHQGKAAVRVRNDSGDLSHELTATHRDLQPQVKATADVSADERLAAASIAPVAVGRAGNGLPEALRGVDGDASAAAGPQA